MIRNIWCVGRNYAEHAHELGNSVPTTPLIFLKAGSCAVIAKSEFHLPEWAEDIHHEVELVLQFGPKLLIDRACVGLDLTERKKQGELKAKGQPWTLAKSFKESCPLSSFFPVKNVQELADLSLALRVNGETRQDSLTSQMVFPLEQLIDYVCRHFPVCEGDLLMTGTPSGVGPLKKGDQVEAEIAGKVSHSWLVK
jgi:acylpyruvate hydrolase